MAAAAYQRSTTLRKRKMCGAGMTDTAPEREEMAKRLREAASLRAKALPWRLMTDAERAPWLAAADIALEHGDARYERGLLHGPLARGRAS
jgi:hypothetical protein